MGCILVEVVKTSHSATRSLVTLSMVVLVGLMSTGLLSCSSDPRSSPVPWDIATDAAGQDTASFLDSSHHSDAALDTGADATLPQLRHGDPCSVPDTHGRCAVGVWQNNRDGSTSLCVPVYQPMIEVCNNEDDDCDGLIDAPPEGQNWEEIAGRQRAELIQAGVEEALIADLDHLICSGPDPCTINSIPEEFEPLPPRAAPFSSVKEEFEAFHHRHASLDKGFTYVCY